MSSSIHSSSFKMRDYWPWVLLLGILLRIGFFFFGVYQDSHFTVKYTDIDYFVFNDAARFVYNGDRSPYLRDTYRYTPLLSYILLPNFYFNNIHLGKFVFVLFDILTGVLIFKLILLVQNRGTYKDSSKTLADKHKAKTPADGASVETSTNRAALLSALWLLNPMVITISTRGNAESVLCAMIMASLYCLAKEQYILGGLLLGLSIHFKLYPVIYAIPIVIYFFAKYGFQSKAVIAVGKIGTSCVLSLLGLTYSMYQKYGYEFLFHSYIYHFVRTDHRHNFSVWNMLLYLESSPAYKKLFPHGVPTSSKWATIPQMLMSSVLIPSMLCFSKYNALNNQKRSLNFLDLTNVIFAQTFAFVIFNKVITSQYFIWYLVYLPMFLFKCGGTTTMKKNAAIVVMWVLAQAVWLYYGYQLEFKGQNVFYPYLFGAHLVFFTGNVWVLGQIIEMIKKSEYVEASVDKTALMEKKQQ